jgi:sigma-B regulation protein RsbU (phosphoserine phosphatase)
MASGLPRPLRRLLIEIGWPPKSLPARITLYLLSVDVFLFLLQKILGFFTASFGEALGGWVTFLSFVVVALLFVLVLRWVRQKVLWRLRNRLIVTYGFIGLVPATLVAAMAVITFYLFAGQFATYLVTAEINSELTAVEQLNDTIAQAVAVRVQKGEGVAATLLDPLREASAAWGGREVIAWFDGRQIVMFQGSGADRTGFSLPAALPDRFHEVVRDHEGLYLRAGKTATVNGRKLTVITSVPFDKKMLEKVAAGVGAITLYSSAINLHNVESDQSPAAAQAGDQKRAEAGPGSSAVFATETGDKKSGIVLRRGDKGYVVESGKEQLQPLLMAGTLPPPARALDKQVTFAAPLFVFDWDRGERGTLALLRVETRPSLLYARLFAALGEFAAAAEGLLIAIAIAFAVIVLLALLIGTRLTRTITRSVANLYEATQHINRGDFRHRIEVRERDQLAELQKSFNSMTASLEKLIQEQREKQRLENELAIAQEVQAQLFPRQITQLESLEVHGFCRPARTVSGDYYDFLPINSDKLGLAVGDVSGKGISAALLMATIHSAVRAYILEGIPVLNSPLAVGGGGNGHAGVEVSPATLLHLLNRQLYHSTPSEKYATLFLGMYEAPTRRLTYTNAGHLPPLLLSTDGSVQRLDCGGTVVGLFDDMSFEESSVQLRQGDLFLAYSDGVTEPENDFGEFGEARLIQLVREHLHLPLARISEVVTAAVDDWIGANEQPDDVTLVLARAR